MGAAHRSWLRFVLAFAAAFAIVPLWASAPSALAAGDANSGNCPTSTEASPGFRTYLPDCRAYELVTPPYTEGARPIVDPGAISVDGEHVIAGAQGAFVGAPNLSVATNNTDATVYEYSRSAGGWQPTALTPPATQFELSHLMAATSDLASTLWGAQPGREPVFKEDIYLRGSAGNFVEVGPGSAPAVHQLELNNGEEELEFAGASGDLSHLVLRLHSNYRSKENLWPGDTTNPDSYSLYEYVGACAATSDCEAREPLLVGVRNEGAPPWMAGAKHINEGAGLISRCGTEIGSGGQAGAPYDTYNAVSGGGQTVFFTAKACGGAGEPEVNELYARTEPKAGEYKTVKISEPMSTDCGACNTSSGLQSAVFQGASQDGKKVFFLTEQELLPGQTGMNLYEYDFSAPEHERIKLVSNGVSEPKVQGVVRVSEDGHYVYFVAKGRLSGADTVAGRNPEEAEPQADADNLYFYDSSSGKLGFVATLLTHSEEEAIENEENAEQNTVGERAANAAYAAYFKALAEGKSGQEAVEILLHTYYGEIEELTGTLGPGGTLAEDRTVWQAEDSRPAQVNSCTSGTTVCEPGRFLVFTSSAKLTAGDTSGVPQIFEYDVQKTTLVRVSIGQGGASGGNVTTFHDAPQLPVQKFTVEDQPTATQFSLALSSDGAAVFFTSAAELAPGAVSGQPSVFEYRAGGVHLISDGRDRSFEQTFPVVRLYGVAGGDSGTRDVFLTTADSLVPQDGDSQISLYDAREDGGFPAPVLAPGCVGETCRGETALAPALSGATSAGEAGGGNLAGAVAKPKSVLTRAQRLKRALSACRKRHGKRRRRACERQARRRYGAGAKTSGRGARRGK
jgi:hypothetical protein